MDRASLRAVTSGPFATLPTPFDPAYNVDFATMAARTEWWIEQGLTKGRGVLKVAAAMGEGPDLTDDEWPKLLDTVVKAANGRGTIFCALKTKATLQTIEDAKRAQDLGAVGLQIDLPIFHHPVQDDLIRYFSDISAAIEIGILVYNTWWFSDGSFGDRSMAPATVRHLADTTEHVVGIKWSTPPEVEYDEMRRFSDVMSVIDNTGDIVRCVQNGGTGYISDTAIAHPQVDFEFWDAIVAKRWSEAQAVLDRFHNPLGEFVGRTKHRSGGYRVGKAMMALLGQPVGPPRPPTLPLQDDEIAELRTLLTSFGWLNAEGKAV